LQGPIADQAAREFKPALTELSNRLGLGSGRLAVMGGSMGAAVALLALAESDADIAAAVLVSPLIQLRPAVDALGRRFGVTYPWSEPSLAVARRLDFVPRADESARRQPQPAILLIVGEEDDVAFRRSATEFRAALSGRYADPSRVDMVLVPGMGHALAEEPGIEPAPQTPHAAEVDRVALDWLRRHLAG
jgi:alpha-beta hydrolase superfamily lysophospholipase